MDDQKDFETGIQGAADDRTRRRERYIRAAESAVASLADDCARLVRDIADLRTRITAESLPTGAEDRIATLEFYNAELEDENRLLRGIARAARTFQSLTSPGRSEVVMALCDAFEAWYGRKAIEYYIGTPNDQLANLKRMAAAARALARKLGRPERLVKWPMDYAKPETTELYDAVAAWDGMPPDFGVAGTVDFPAADGTFTVNVSAGSTPDARRIRQAVEKTVAEAIGTKGTPDMSRVQDLYDILDDPKVNEYITNGGRIWHAVYGTPIRAHGVTWRRPPGGPSSGADDVMITNERRVIQYGGVASTTLYTYWTGWVLSKTRAGMTEYRVDTMQPGKYPSDESVEAIGTVIETIPAGSTVNLVTDGHGWNWLELAKP